MAAKTNVMINKELQELKEATRQIVKSLSLYGCVSSADAKKILKEFF